MRTMGFPPDCQVGKGFSQDSGVFNRSTAELTAFMVDMDKLLEAVRLAESVLDKESEVKVIFIRYASVMLSRAGHHCTKAREEDQEEG